MYPAVATRLAMSIDGKADPGRISGKDWRALAKSIQIGKYLEDTVLELAEELPQSARQLSRTLESEYGSMGIAASIAEVIGKRARRTKRLLKE